MTDEEFEAMYGISKEMAQFDGMSDESDCCYAGDLQICTHCEHWDFDNSRCKP